MDRPANYTLLTGTTTELVVSPRPCVLVSLTPWATTVGTLTVRNSATAAAGTVIDTAAIGLTQAGKNYAGPDGVKLGAGLTVKCSSASDSVLIGWRPL